MQSGEDVIVYFREDQRFREPILWVIIGLGIVAMYGLALWMLYRHFIQHQPVGNPPMSDVGVLAVVAAIVVVESFVTVLMVTATLQVEVSSLGLFVRFVPFHRKVRQISLDDVVAVTSVRYRPLLDYGGWGIRWRRKGKAYNVSGNLGVRIDYANGYHLLIGSQRPKELSAAIQRIWTPPTGTPIAQETYATAPPPTSDNESTPDRT